MPDRAPDTTHLSDAELHDVIVVTTANNEAEALYLSQRLQEAGIPVAKTGESVSYHNPLPNIRVPRTLAPRASEIIAAARKEALNRGAENASELEAGPARSALHDPLLETMLKFSELPLEERKTELSLFIVEWFANGQSNHNIARYLAAADLTPEESHDLVASVYENQRERAQQKQASSWKFGALYLVLGLLLFGTGAMAGASGMLPRVAGMAFIGLGVVKMLSATRSTSRSTPPGTAEQPPTGSTPEK